MMILKEYQINEKEVGGDVAHASHINQADMI